MHQEKQVNAEEEKRREKRPKKAMMHLPAGKMKGGQQAPKVK
jgi:hypothetical protein